MTFAKRRVECGYADCVKTFGRRPDLERHEDENHKPPKICPVPDCGYTVKRKGRLRKHMETEHQVADASIGSSETNPSTFSAQARDMLASGDSTGERSSAAVEHQHLAADTSRMDQVTIIAQFNPSETAHRHRFISSTYFDGAQSTRHGVPHRTGRMITGQQEYIHFESPQSMRFIISHDTSTGLERHFPSIPGVVNSGTSSAQPGQFEFDDGLTLTPFEMDMFCNGWESEWWNT